MGHYWWSGDAYDVAVRGHYAYVIGTSLLVLDVSNPSTPVLVGNCRSGSGRAIEVSGEYAFAAISMAGLRVFDVSNPADPIWVASCYTGDEDVALAGHYAYMVGASALDVVDVSTPTVPVLVTRYELAPWSKAVTVMGSYGYVVGWAGLTILRTTVPADLNCDGRVDNFDIDPFVLLLTDPATYAGRFPDCNALNGDVNADGRIDWADVDPFVRLLTRR